MNRTRIRSLMAIGVIGIIALFAVNLANSVVKTTYHDVKVERLINQQILSGGYLDDIQTEYRYLVVTNKGTFICESSILYGKFNNSDIFWHLKEGSSYTMTVVGVGKSFLFDYANIIEVDSTRSN